MTKALEFTEKKLEFYMREYDPEDYNPDEIDRRIIRYLSEDGRASYTQIAESIGVTPATVRNRLTRLIELKIIRNFKPIVDKKLYNLDISAFFMITLESSKLTEGVVTHLQDFTQISQISILASDPNIVCNVFAKNMEDFSILLAKVTQIDGIKDVKSNFIIKSVAPGCFMQ
ncbi:MAG: Lrp/AsnC family transcriptional regulator [Candidatus Helarchaeota archaeon]|nr:Lrp/AsnC family transcriptional regulator [Candidatus Helarchaeota archaeon]